MPTTEPQTIAVFRAEIHAHLVAGRLESEGIETMILFGHGMLSEGGGPIQLQVSAEDEERAREIIREMGIT